MAEMAPGYASPGLRWGLLLADYPDSKWAARVGTAEDVGIPGDFAGAGAFCIVTINFPPEANLEPVLGWKPTKPRGEPDDWNVLCTKALGRALKRAGYPGSLPDLNALLRWRHRLAEIEAVRAGKPIPERPAPIREPEQVGAAPDPDREDEDDVVDGDDAPDDSPADDPDAPDANVDHELMARVNALAPAAAKRVDDWMEKTSTTFALPISDALVKVVEAEERRLKAAS